MVARLTQARRALCQALDSNPALRARLRRVWTGDEPEGLAGLEGAGNYTGEPLPALGELPALALRPARSPPPAWLTVAGQHWPYTLEATLWTHAGALAEAEDLWEQVTTAWQNAAPAPGAPTFVQAATGLAGPELGPLTVAPTLLGRRGPVVWRWDWTVALHLSWPR